MPPRVAMKYQRTAKKERNAHMTTDIEFKRIERLPEEKGPSSWEYSHDEIWECNATFDDRLAKELIETRLYHFPVVRASYTLDPREPHRVTVHVVEDNCM